MALLDDSLIYKLPENVQETVLIQGSVQCFQTKEDFKAPMMLPKTKRIYWYSFLLFLTLVTLQHCLICCMIVVSFK